MDLSNYTSTYDRTENRRYALASRWLHWVTAVMIFALVPLGWIFAEFKTTPGSREAYTSAHKTLGLIIFAVVLARIVFRLAWTAPPLPRTMAAWEKGLAHASHWLLYLVLLVMPISGYIMSSGSRFPIMVLGLWEFPKLPVSKAVGQAAEQIHVATQFALYALVILHIGATAWHIFVRRDDILARMLPRQVNRG